MHTRILFARACLSVTAALLLSISDSSAQTEYVPIPLGFDFPATEATLLAALNNGDVKALRTHAWMVFAGLTQPARPEDPQSEALWETWYTGREVFAVGAAPQGVRSLERELVVPRQFQKKGAVPQAVGASQLAFTLFNEELRTHTRTERLHLMATLQEINAGWTSATPVQDRKLKDYPPKAMSLKTVWMRAAKQDTTALPIWDQQPRTAHAPEQDIETWKRVVVVDSSRDTIPPGEKKDAVLRLPNQPSKTFPGSNVVPLKAFYHFPLNAAQAARVGASVGDYMVLVGLHYTTKEIPNWVWATFWWHDQPDAGQFAADRPAETFLKGPWRNYLMDVSYDMDRPIESDNTPNAVFNPWLEAPFEDGVNSNCMTCHQRAVWSLQDPNPDFLPVTRGAAAVNDPLFHDSTKVDFLWSLLREGNN